MNLQTPSPVQGAELDWGGGRKGQGFAAAPAPPWPSKTSPQLLQWVCSKLLAHGHLWGVAQPLLLKRVTAARDGK